MEEIETLYQQFIKEKELQNLTRNQVNFIKEFLKLNTFGITDKNLVIELFLFKKRNGN